MGGGQSGTSHSTTEVVVPSEVRTLMNAVVPDVQAAFQAGGFPSFMSASPFAAPSDQTMAIINSIVGGAGEIPSALMQLLGIGPTLSATTGLTPGQAAAQGGFASLIPSVAAGSAPSRDVIMRLLTGGTGAGGGRGFGALGEGAQGIVNRVADMIASGAVPRDAASIAAAMGAVPGVSGDEYGPLVQHLLGGGRASTPASTTSGPLDALNRALAVATGQLTAPLTSPGETSSIDYLTRVLNAPIGSSPATLEAIKNWQNTALPTINNAARLAGYGQSGALPAAIGQSMSALLAPLYGTEIADRTSAVNALLGEGQVLEARPGSRATTAANLGTAAAALPAGLAQILAQMNAGDIAAQTDLLSRIAGLGGAQLSQPLQAIASALGAGQTALDVSGIPQQQAQQDYLRRQALLEEISNVVTGGIVPSTFGQSGGGRFDNRGAGLLGALFGGGAK